MTRKGCKQTLEHIRKRITPESIRKRFATKFHLTPAYREKMRKAKSGSNNPRYGLHLSEELKKRISESEKGKKVVVSTETKSKLSKALKGKFTGEKHWGWKGGRRNYRLRQPLLYAIRNSQKYAEWRTKVLQKNVIYPNVTKGIQVHHLKKVTDILKENNIQTLEDALKCEALWDINNGVVLLKGEHFIISCLERHKKISRGFIKFVEQWIRENEEKAVEL